MKVRPSGNGKSLVLWAGTAATKSEGYAFLAIFLLVVEINLGGKFGGHAFSKGETNQNTSETLSAQNLTILFLSPQIIGHFCSVPGDWTLQLRGTTLPEGRGGMEQD